MPYKRSLDQESREALIARAKKAGVAHAERMTRVELVDELAKRAHEGDAAKRREARGLLGRARDLVASLLEKGLNLPEAAARLRHLAVPELPPTPPPVATVTLAEIFAAQGHVERAVTVLEEVLGQEPEHTHAALLLDKLTARLAADRPVEVRFGPTEAPKDGASEIAQALWPVRPEVVAEAAPAPPGGGPIPMLDDVPLPERYGVDEVVILPVDPTTALLYWEIASGREAILRVIARVGGEVTVREVLPIASIGETYVYGLPAGAMLMAEIVFHRGGEVLVRSASNVVHVPWDAPSARVASDVVVWGEARPLVGERGAPGSRRDEAEDLADGTSVRAMRLSAAIARALVEQGGAVAEHHRAPPFEAHRPRGSSGELSSRPSSGAWAPGP